MQETSCTEIRPKMYDMLALILPHLDFEYMYTTSLSENKVYTILKGWVYFHTEML